MKIFLLARALLIILLQEALSNKSFWKKQIWRNLASCCSL